MAGNQTGKSEVAAYEVAMHLTGEYPDDWPGHRFNRPINAWAAGVTTDSTRDNPQNKLVGPPGSEEKWGTGFVPKARLLDCVRGRGIPNALDSIVVRHVSGETSHLGFKSYEQGREKFQGPTLDLIWLDEECDLGIYTECLTRTNAVPDGRVLMTFTPLLGMSEVVRMFLTDDRLARMAE